MSSPDPLQSDTERRLLLAIVLSMAVLFITPYLYQKLFPQPPGPSEVEQVAEVEKAEEPAPATAEPVLAELQPITPTQANPRVIEIENSDLVLRWNSVGAVLESARLKHYHLRNGSVQTGDSPVLLELIPQQLPPTLPRPLMVRLQDEELDQALSRSVYEVMGAPSPVIKAPVELTFVYQHEKVRVTKRVKVPESGYALEMEIRVSSGGRPIPFSLLLGPGIGDESIPDEEFSNRQVAYYAARSVTQHAINDLKTEAQQFEGQARWVALDSKYFSYLILGSDRIQGARFYTETWKREGADAEEQERALLSAQVRLQGTGPVTVFLGPKDHEVLGSVDATLSELINYGWFAFLVWPLLVSLKFIYAYIHNYGWAIIILTFVINVLLFPLRYKQMASMKKMSELQPKLRSIQDKYKRMKRDDPRRAQMNTEVMALYKEHGVNPLGGCLPLVIQMPFLFAFYRMLDYSIELRGAPFLLWIQDLSRHDPYYVSPIVMGISMVVQQKMTPGGAVDPTQRRMMMMLPIVFTFMFLGLSSGLVIYFLFSNLFAMMFQLLLARSKPKSATAKPPKKK